MWLGPGQVSAYERSVHPWEVSTSVGSTVLLSLKKKKTGLRLNRVVYYTRVDLLCYELQSYLIASGHCNLESQEAMMDGQIYIKQQMQ